MFKSASLSLRLIFYPPVKKDTEYLVSPNKSAICSAMAIALSSARAVNVIVIFFSSESMTYTYNLTSLLKR